MELNRYLAAMLRAEFYNHAGFSEKILRQGLEKLGRWKIVEKLDSTLYENGRISFILNYSSNSRATIHSFLVSIGPNGYFDLIGCDDFNSEIPISEYPQQLVKLLKEALSKNVVLEDSWMDERKELTEAILEKIKSGGDGYRRMFSFELNDFRLRFE